MAGTITLIFRCEESLPIEDSANLRLNLRHMSCLSCKSSLGEKVLPTLQNTFLEELEPPGPIQDGIIGQFIALRQVASHPVGVTLWERKWQEEDR
jgi:hypothetical protein